MITLADLQGHWRRKRLKAPGVEDHDTKVHWAQAGTLYADIRIPAERPALNGAQALSDLDPKDLLALMAAEGFAGEITLQAGTCTWARDVNWHGEPEGVDAGHMRFDASGDLIEDGVHADYSELWKHERDEGLNAARVAIDGIEGVLVSSDSMFLIGLGRTGAPASAPLIAALKRGGKPAELSQHFSSQYALGHWEGAQGIADLSTNPFAEGLPVLERGANGKLTWHATSYHGARNELPLLEIRPKSGL